MYRILLSLLICVIFTAPVYSAKKKRNGAPSQSVVLQGPLQGTKPEAPNTTIPVDILVLSQQMILVDYETGTVLLEKNAHVPTHPSSMTKILTAMVVMDKIKAGAIQADQLFTVSKNAWRLEGSSMMLNIGNQVRVDDLLKGLIIQSGNDASVTLAEGCSGSEGAFAAEMTRKAHALGAVNTHFKNASGLPQDDHLTTVRDLATIAIHAVRDYPEYYHIYSEKEFTHNNIKQGNRNPLLYRNMGCDGIKTGHSNIAGYGMVASCLNQSNRFILVINGLPNMQARADEAVGILTWAMNTFVNHVAYKKNEIIGKVPLLYGKENFVSVTVASDTVVTIARSGVQDITKSMTYADNLKAPLEKGQVVGTLTLTSSALPKPVEFPLVAFETVEKGNFIKRFVDFLGSVFFGKKG
jgi:D-alanyl-D-alanine carboxypeptidase (penicillin-binding protein 5/6)